MKFFWLAFINSIDGSLTSLSSAPTPLNLRAHRLGLKTDIPDNDSIDRIIQSYNIGVAKGTLKSAKDPNTTMYIVLCQIASGKSDSTDNTPCKDYIVGDEKVKEAKKVLGELLERARLVGEDEKRRQSEGAAEGRESLDRGVDGSVISEHEDAGSTGKSGGGRSPAGEGGFSDDESEGDDDISTDGSDESIHSANSSDSGLGDELEALLMGIDRRSSGSVRSNAAERGSQEFSDEEGFEGSGESRYGRSGGEDDSSGSTPAVVSASSRRVAQVGGVGPAAAARDPVSGHSPSDD